MIKRIVVALDPDPDTPFATRYALHLAKRFDASVTGLAVIDTRNIRRSMAGVGVGDLHGKSLWTELAEDTRELASDLLDNFEMMVKQEDIRHTAVKKEGTSFEQIIEEMNYHDLLIIGSRSHFYYNEPERETDTLPKIVKGGNAPTLVISDEYQDVNKVLVAFDGSAPAARSLKAFVHLLPYGSDMEVELLTVRRGTDKNDSAYSAYVSSQAEKYLQEHHFKSVSKKVMEKGSPSKRIHERIDASDPDLIILGAHSVSAIRRLTFGSTTHELINHTTKPLFMSP